MSTLLHPLPTDLVPPPRFTYPFCYDPHPLARQAAEALQQQLRTMTLTEGKMFGVLVVGVPGADPTDRAGDGPGLTAGGPAPLAFLAAYSGLLEGRNDWPYFVPPLYDAQNPRSYFKREEKRISAMTDDSQRDERRQRSQQLQQWLFDRYRLLNAHGQRRRLVDVWQDYHCSARIRRRYPLPPGGTGDCCAPKLLQYAYAHGLKPLCMAEFWWGPSPRSEVRRHGQYYPACRGKCKPVLTWMLSGLDVDPNPEEQAAPVAADVGVVYEDAWLMVVNKPSGLLSVPGRIAGPSVAAILHGRYPGALLAHRLDMGTSGLMIAAKSRAVHALLQQQFRERTVSKRYTALLDADCHPEPFTVGQRGTISLPLLSDPINRPRQVVDYERGKEAVTDYEVTGPYRVRLWPHTGRTHQLRMHCAHADGLGCPIRGDELYGGGHPSVLSYNGQAERLCLHADRLEFTHPVTGKRLCIDCPPDF